MDRNLQKCRHILLGKLTYAVLSGISFQILILTIYLIIVNVQPTSPVDGLSSFFSDVSHPATWAYCTVFVATVIAQSIVCSKDYVVPRHYPSSRFWRWVSVMSLHNQVLVWLHAGVGLTHICVFLGLGSSVYSEVLKNGKLNGDSFFLLMGGSWTGVYYFLRIYAGEKKVLFPVVHQRKLVRFKANLLGVFKESKTFAVYPAVYFLMAYALLGEFVGSGFAGLFGLDYDSGSNGVIIYLVMYLFSALICFYMNVMTFFYELYLTEPVNFAIEGEEVTLSEAMKLNVPIIQHLACLDFFLLSENSPQRRQQLLTLSNPGGHPHNWNRLVEGCLTILSGFTNSLNKSMAPTKPIKQPVIAQAALITSPVGNHNTSLRNMSWPRCYPDPSDVFPQDPVKPNQFIERFKEYYEKLKERSGYNYLFRELPEADIRRCLGDGQMVVWTTQALATMCALSLKEDRFGVVQKDLPVIVSALTELKVAVERLGRIPALTRRAYGPDDFNTKMRGSILSATKRSLFDICSVFGPYLKDFNLKKEVVRELQTFGGIKL